ncbi:hypothetical protein Ade02nite_02240 [Paractinoplanes deccanensis]|uniref:Nuclear transport factor 2 family protein n=1 Tax=Paractinoplanes deccanensis TaxID=113561 RepID=A0ABQ3XV39_9ACTN|nr:hypothetical protein [Actinoplanes deccanensis]GID71583.1 hypothetical protein Ade02nite_02240 [Actinoplanes deccanensis]
MRISDALRDLVFAPGDDPTTFDRYFSPTYTHRLDGAPMDRQAFEAMLAGLRRRVESGTVTVLDELTEGSRYAERHVYEATLTDGTKVKAESYVFGTLAADGRFDQLSETGVPLA